MSGIKPGQCVVPTAERQERDKLRLTVLETVGLDNLGSLVSNVGHVDLQKKTPDVSARNGDGLNG